MKLFILGMAVLFLSACSSQKFAGETLAEIKINEIKSVAQQPLKVSAVETIQSYRVLMEFPVENPFRPRAMQRLADLLIDYGEQREVQFAATSEIQIIDEYTEAIQVYEALLRDYPYYPETDPVLYQLSRVYDKQGEIEKSGQLLSRLVKEYPGSQYFSEAHFRIGELMFLYADYPRAAESYKAVLDIGKDNQFYEQSLLKYSWTVFKQDRLHESLRSFFSLLDMTLDQAEFDPVSGKPVAMGRADQEILTDILRGMTLIFALKNNPQELETYTNRYGQFHYNHLIYQSLAELYHKDERYLNEAQTYSIYIAHYPDTPSAAIFQLRQVDSYRFLNDTQQITVAKEKFLNDFWKPGLVQGEGMAEYISLTSSFAKAYLNDLTAYYHSRFQKAKLVSDFDVAVKWYQKYLNDFHSEPDAVEKHFLLAELFFENSSFKQAGAEYEQVAYNYYDYEKSAEAGYAAILSYQKLLKTDVSDEFLDDWRQLKRQSALRFVSKFPDDQRVVNTLLTIANDDFERGDYDNALLLSELLLASEQQLSIDESYSVWTIVGHVSFQRHDYLRSEQAFQAAHSNAADNHKQKRESEEWLAASVYKQAEALLATGEIKIAVEQLLRIESVAPGSEIAAQAKYDAATELIGIEEWQRAMGLLEQFQQDYPRHKLQSDVPAKLAFVYLKLGETSKAAYAYEMLASRGKDAALQQQALLQSAQLYQQVEDLDKAAIILKRYIYKYPKLTEQAFYVRSQLADVYGQLDQFGKRNFWLEDIVTNASLSGIKQNNLIQFVAAKASLTLAEQKLIAFDAVRLVEPLRESLTRKKLMMETALAAYRKTGGYNYAESTTAANHRIGEIYFKLSTALLESARPAGLDDEELEQYEMMLEEQAYPFEEQAIKFLESNVARVDEGIYTGWVDKSFATLGELLPVQYAKQELPGGVIDVMH